ncbi:MAG: helix-turn-helix domain-containing protein [Spirosomataceae bacterium]
MAFNSEKVRLFFGLKIKQLRIEKCFSLSDLAQQVGFSVSYLNEIEKGKKYPKADKIFALASALDTDYDTLVSLKLSKKLEPIAELLNSNVLTELPLEMFGVHPSDFLELMSEAPSKLSAFISTIVEISRNYDMHVEQFFFSVLRSYQEMHDNYFVEMEDAASRFLAEHHLADSPTLDADFLEKCLSAEYGYQVENFDETTHPDLMSLRSVFVPKQNKLLINRSLNPEQRAFTLGREVGYHYMKIKVRPLVSSVIEVRSFDEVFNNFKASYFARAILINRQVLIPKLASFFSRLEFDGQAFLNLLGLFNTTPEMFLHRMTNVMTSHFGINQLFFLRFNHTMSDNLFYLEKELHLAQLHSPHGTALNEHYCRRWVSLTILKELETQRQQGTWSGKPLCRAQISDYIDSGNQYFVLSLAKPSPPKPDRNSSVTLGFAIDEKLKKVFKFLADPALPQRKVNETCEHCALTPCPDRAEEPTTWQKKQHIERLKKALEGL